MAKASAFSAEAVTSRFEEAIGSKEWAAIVANARSLQSLEVTMRTIAEAGINAGINLRASGDSVEFEHLWMFIAAQPAG